MRKLVRTVWPRERKAASSACRRRTEDCWHESAFMRAEARHGAVTPVRERYGSSEMKSAAGGRRRRRMTFVCIVADVCHQDERGGGGCGGRRFTLSYTPSERREEDGEKHQAPGSLLIRQCKLVDRAVGIAFLSHSFPAKQPLHPRTHRYVSRAAVAVRSSLDTPGRRGGRSRCSWAVRCDRATARRRQSSTDGLGLRTWARSGRPMGKRGR